MILSIITIIGLVVSMTFFVPDVIEPLNLSTVSTLNIGYFFGLAAGMVIKS